MPNHTDLDLLARPTPGQQTKAQAHTSNLNLPGFGIPSASTYELYREMRNDPTVSIGFAAATSPIIASNWNYVTKKAPAGAKKFIRDTLEPLKPWFVEQAIWAIQYGWQGFEKIFDMVDGRIAITKLKPLLQDKTTIIVNKETGSFQGLWADQQNQLFVQPGDRRGTFLPAEKAFVYTHQWDTFNGLYGRSRFENFKLDWQGAQKTRDKQGQFQDKISSVLLLLEYPEGKSTNASGTEIDNDVAAQQLIDSLRSGLAVAVQNTLHPMAEEFIRQGVTNPEMLKAWRLTLLETAAGHGAEFVTQRQDFDKRILRGLLVPERSIMEGLGSSAESESHAHIGLQMAEQTLNELIRQVNTFMVNQLLALNFGLDAVGTIRVEPEPIADDKKQLMKEIIRMTIGSPQNADLALTLLDIDKMLDNLGLPKASTSLKANLAEMRNRTSPENPNEGQPGEPRTNRQDVEQETDRGSNANG